MLNDVTCEACRRRLATVPIVTLRRMYRIGAHGTVPRALAQGHAMFWLPGTKAMISLCRAQRRQETAR